MASRGRLRKRNLKHVKPFRAIFPHRLVAPPLATHAKSIVDEAKIEAVRGADLTLTRCQIHPCRMIFFYPIQIKVT